MRIRLAGSIQACTYVLQALCRANIDGCLRDPSLRAALLQRVSSPPGVGFVYTRDEDALAQEGEAADDVWSDFASLLGAHHALGRGDSDPIMADCEDLTAVYGACARIQGQRVEVAITQPNPPAGMAHAYLLINGRVLDPSVINGMRDPGRGFYGAGESARVLVP